MLVFSSFEKLRKATKENKSLYPILRDVSLYVYEGESEEGVDSYEAWFKLTAEAKEQFIRNAGLLVQKYGIGDPEDNNDLSGFSGEIFVCEVAEDLLAVTGLSLGFETVNGRYPSIADKGQLVFDAVVPVVPEGTLPGTELVIENTDWIMFFIATTSSGGPVFYVPRHLYAEGNVVGHFNATSLYWRREAESPSKLL